MYYIDIILIFDGSKRRQAARGVPYDRRRRTPRPSVLEIDPTDDGSASPPAKIVQKEDLRRAMQALNELPQRQRDVMYLHVCEGLPLREIAEVLGIGYGAVKANLAVGRKSLRNTLKDIYAEVDGAAKQ